MLFPPYFPFGGWNYLIAAHQHEAAAGAPGSAAAPTRGRGGKGGSVMRSGGRSVGKEDEDVEDGEEEEEWKRYREVMGPLQVS